MQRGADDDSVVQVETEDGNVVLRTRPDVGGKHFAGTLSMRSKSGQSIWSRPTLRSVDNFGGPGIVVNVRVGLR